VGYSPLQIVFGCRRARPPARRGVAHSRKSAVEGKERHTTVGRMLHGSVCSLAKCETHIWEMSISERRTTGGVASGRSENTWNVCPRGVAAV